MLQINSETGQVKAHPPDLCNVCFKDLKSGSSYYDARMVQGSWAWLCYTCFQLYGIALGTGCGQKYDSDTDMKLEG